MRTGAHSVTRLAAIVREILGQFDSVYGASLDGVHERVVVEADGLGGGLFGWIKERYGT